MNNFSLSPPIEQEADNGNNQNQQQAISLFDSHLPPIKQEDNGNNQNQQQFFFNLPQEGLLESFPLQQLVDSFGMLHNAFLTYINNPSSPNLQMSCFASTTFNNFIQKMQQQKNQFNFAPQSEFATIGMNNEALGGETSNNLSERLNNQKQISNNQKKFSSMEIVIMKFIEHTLRINGYGRLNTLVKEDTKNAREKLYAAKYSSYRAQKRKFISFINIYNEIAQQLKLKTADGKKMTNQVEALSQKAYKKHLKKLEHEHPGYKDTMLSVTNTMWEYCTIIPGIDDIADNEVWLADAKKGRQAATLTSQNKPAQNELDQQNGDIRKKVKLEDINPNNIDN